MPRYSKRSYRRPSQNSRLKKRWYFDASIPKSVPLIGGSSLKMGSGNLSKRSLNSIVKEVQLKNAVLKHKVIDTAATATMLANTHITHNPLGNIPVGTGENARLSTDIVIKSIIYHFTITPNLANGAPLTNAPIFLRFMWVRSETDVLASQDTFGSGLGTSSLYISGFSGTILAPLDKDKVTVLSDTMVKIPQGNQATINNTILYKTECPLKDFPFRYSTPTSAFSVVNKNVYLVVFPYQEGATTGTTNICNYQFTTDIQYVDVR